MPTYVLCSADLESSYGLGPYVGILINICKQWKNKTIKKIQGK